MQVCFYASEANAWFQIVAGALPHAGCLAVLIQKLEAGSCSIFCCMNRMTEEKQPPPEQAHLSHLVQELSNCCATAELLAGDRVPH